MHQLHVIRLGMQSINDKPLISIVTCVRNQQRYLPELLESVAAQKVKNFEHVIIDGESSDDSKSLLLKYQNENSSHYPIQIYSYPPHGISDAMNKGLEHANGDWIIVVQGDDYLEDANATERMQRVIYKSPNKFWFVGNAVRDYFGIVFNTHTHFIRPLLYRLLLIGINLIPHQNTLMHKSIFELYGNFPVHLKTHMETDLYLRLLANKVYPLSVNTSFAVLRRHALAISMNPIIYRESVIALRPRLKELRKKITWGNP